MVADAGSAGFASDEVDSFGAWLEPLLPTGYRLALGMLRNGDDAEDAVEEAAAKAWRRRSSFRPEADPRLWFLAIVANECKMARRKSWLAGRWFRAATVHEAEAPADFDEVDQLRQGLSRLGSGARLARSEEHTSELQSQSNLVCRLLLEKKKNIETTIISSDR